MPSYHHPHIFFQCLQGIYVYLICQHDLQGTTVTPLGTPITMGNSDSKEQRPGRLRSDSRRESVTPGSNSPAIQPVGESLTVQRLSENGNTDPTIVDRILSTLPSKVQDLDEAAKPTSQLCWALEILVIGTGTQLRLAARASKRGTKGALSVIGPIGTRNEHTVCGMSMWTGRCCV